MPTIPQRRWVLRYVEIRKVFLRRVGGAGGGRHKIRTVNSVLFNQLLVRERSALVSDHYCQLKCRNVILSFILSVVLPVHSFFKMHLLR